MKAAFGSRRCCCWASASSAAWSSRCSPPPNRTRRCDAYLKVRPPGALGAIRRQLAAEGLIDLKQQRELKWDLSAAVFGIIFCFTMTYSFFMSVMLQWEEAAWFAIAALLTGAAYFACWLRSAHLRRSRLRL